MQLMSARVVGTLLMLALLRPDATGTTARQWSHAISPQASSVRPTTAAEPQSSGPALSAAAIRQAKAAAHAFLAADTQRLLDMSTPRLQSQLPADKLRRLARDLHDQYGARSALGEATVRLDRADPSLTYVRLPAFLERQSVTFSITVTPDGRVEGLHIVGLTPRGEAVPRAAYVDGARFDEQAVTLSTPAGPRDAILALPSGEGPFPAVVLISAVERHNLNESLGGAHVLRDLAQGLGSRGIAVLRPGDPVRAEAGGHAEALREPLDEIPAEVASAGLGYLGARGEVDAQRLFVLSHGWAGFVTSGVVARDAKERVPAAGLILVAAPARASMDVVLGHVDSLSKLDGNIAPEEQDLIDQVIEARAAIRQPENTSRVDTLFDAPLGYWSKLDAHDPPTDLAAALDADSTLRALILHCGRDFQVTAEDFGIWRERLAAEARVTTRHYPTLNHLMADGQGTPNPNAYANPRPVAAEIIADIAAWITSAPASEQTRPAATSPASATP